MVPGVGAGTGRTGAGIASEEAPAYDAGQWVEVLVPMMPPAACNPNARVHWAERARAAQEARNTAYQAALWLHECSEGFSGLRPGRVVMDIAVHWCCGRKTLDTDNLVAATKNMRDGIAEALLGGTDAAVEIGRVEQTRGGGVTRITLREA